jgi:hypothetical protein
MNPQPFDPQQVGRYTVIRVYYEYANQPGGEKLFVVLKHERLGKQVFCWCVKATSQVQRFSEEMLRGCVFYSANELTFFERATVVDTSNILTLLHETLGKEAARGRFCIEGKMPDDFHEKFVGAVRNSTILEPKKKAKLLAAVGESLYPSGDTASSAL